jgi:putative ABC transport system permease protein
MGRSSTPDSGTTPFFRRALEDLRDDVRLSFRTWRKNFGLALAVVATLTVGIGISSSVFTLLNAQFLRSRIDVDPDSYAQLHLARTTTQDPSEEEFGRLSIDDITAIQKRSRSLSRVVGSASVRGPLGEGGRLIQGDVVTCNFFSVTQGRPPLLGRLLDPGDCLSGARVAVISQALWRDHFGSDPNIVGRVISFNGPLTVVGVVASEGGGVRMPYTLGPAWNILPSDAKYRASGRLAPGYTRASAEAELNVILTQEDRLHPGRHSKLVISDGSAIESPNDKADAWRIVLLVLAVVIMIVVLVSANVLTLILSRAHARKPEIALRLSLGASVMRLLRMLVTETMVLAAVAAAFSAVIAYQLPPFLLPYLGMDHDVPIRPDWRVWTFMTVLTLVATLGSGLTPALEALKVNTTDAMKGRAGMGNTKGKFDVRNILIIGQVAVAVALLGGSAIFVRAYLRTLQTEAGFDTQHTMFVRLASWGPLKTTWPIAHQSIARAVRAQPGIEGVALTRSKPPKGNSTYRVVSPTGVQVRIRENMVSPDFFSTLGVPLLRGRPLQADDPTAGNVVPAVISQRLATELFQGRDPLGQNLTLPWRQWKYTVVGVAGDIAQPSRSIEPVLYRPLAPGPIAVLLVRFSGDPSSVSAAVAATIERTAPGVYGRPETFDSNFDQDTYEIGRSTALVAVVGAGTLLLALIGVYGTISFAASRRRKEMGIRVALGAHGLDIVRALTTRPMVYVLVGLALGTVLAVVLVPLAGILERDLQASDPLAYAGAMLLVAAAAVLAMVKPTHRAMSADPIAALRDQ